MKDTASIFFHCDKTASHHIRLLLDEIFGAEHFLSEVIWRYRRWSNSQRNLLGAHQTIYWYSKTENYLFNELIQDYSETTNLDQILQKRQRNQHGKTIYARSESGDIIYNGPKKGVPLSDVWEIPYLNPKARERVGYPTQKPLLLLERVIQLASQPGDIVLDPFCGSGTTLVAASLLNRDYMGIDISEKAAQLAAERLQHPVRSTSTLLNNGRVSYDNLPAEVKRLLAHLPVRLVQRNSGIDALYHEFLEGMPVVIRVQREHETLIEAAQKLSKAGRKKSARLMILFQTRSQYQPETLIDHFPEDVIVVHAPEVSIEQIVKTYQPNQPN